MMKSEPLARQVRQSSEDRQERKNLIGYELLSAKLHDKHLREELWIGRRSGNFSISTLSKGGSYSIVMLSLSLVKRRFQ
jgi:hypothetical protein